MKRKIIFLIFSIVTVVMMCSLSVSAEVHSGQCGDNAYWKLDTSTGVMTISGTGEMWDYDMMVPEGRSPWYNVLDYNLSDYIDSIVIGNGITHIGSCAFVNTNITDLEIPDNVTSIGRMAFSGNGKLTDVKISNNVSLLEHGTFGGCGYLESVTIPKKVTCIKWQAFDSCDALKTVYYKGSEVDWNSVIVENYNDPLKNAKVVFSEVHTCSWSKSETVSSTCISEGYIRYICESCGNSKTEELSLVDHSWTCVDSTPATCTDAGNVSYKCSMCDELKVEEIPALGHEFGEWEVSTEATPGKEGVERAYCTRECGEYESRIIPALPEESDEEIYDDDETENDEDAEAYPFDDETVDDTNPSENGGTYETIGASDDPDSIDTKTIVIIAIAGAVVLALLIVVILKVKKNNEAKRIKAAKQAPRKAKKVCPNCGQALEDGDSVCKVCETKIES